MLTSIDVKFIFDISCLSGSLGNKELFSSGNILQIEDVVRRVGFLLFLLCFYFFLAKRAKCFAILYHFHNNSASSSGLSGSGMTDVISSHIAKFFQIWSTVASYDELCLGF